MEQVVYWVAGVAVAAAATYALRFAAGQLAVGFALVVIGAVAAGHHVGQVDENNQAWLDIQPIDRAASEVAVTIGRSVNDQSSELTRRFRQLVEIRQESIAPIRDALAAAQAKIESRRASPRVPTIALVLLIAGLALQVLSALAISQRGLGGRGFDFRPVKARNQQRQTATKPERDP